MGIQRLKPVNGGTDWSKYVPNRSTWSGTLVNGLQFYTVYDVTGKGYLSYALAIVTSDFDVRMRITIDGVVKHDTWSPATAYTPTGIGPASLIDGGGRTSAGSTLFMKGVLQTNVLLTSPVFLNYPSTSASTGFVIIEQPIFYNQSLKIELSPRASNLSGVHFVVVGGIGL